MSVALDLSFKGAHRAHFLRVIRRGAKDRRAHAGLKILEMMGLRLFDNIFEKAESATYALADRSTINIDTIAFMIERLINIRVDRIALVSISEPADIQIEKHFGTMLLEDIERENRIRLLDDPFAKTLFKHAYIGIKPPNFGWLFNECMQTLLFSLIYTFYKAGSGRIGVAAHTHHLRDCLTYCIPLGTAKGDPNTWYVACA